MDLVEDEAVEGGGAAAEVEERAVMGHRLDPFIWLELGQVSKCAWNPVVIDSMDTDAMDTRQVRWDILETFWTVYSGRNIAVCVSTPRCLENGWV